MRPDRLIVGEVRGEEALTLFNAMDVGHRGSLGTIHANNARETIVRLENPPMAIPSAMLPLLDIIVVMGRHIVEGKGMIRNVTQISEVTRMESKVLLGSVYERNPQSNQLAKTDIPSHSFEVLSEIIGVEKSVLKKEMLVRKSILEWMLKSNITENASVLQVIQQYYIDPETILKAITSDLEKEARSNKPE
jgi:flagellar protein FlaI